MSFAIIGLVQGAGVSQGTPNPGGCYPVVSRDFLATLIIPLQFAVLFGIALSILLNTIRQSNQVVVTQWVLQPQGFPLEQPAPRHLPSQQLTVLHIYGRLFFAAAKKVEEVLPAVGSATRAVVAIDLRGTSEIGSTFATVLQRYTQAPQARQGKLMLVGVLTQRLTIFRGAHVKLCKYI